MNSVALTDRQWATICAALQYIHNGGVVNGKTDMTYKELENEIRRQLGLDPA